MSAPTEKRPWSNGPRRQAAGLCLALAAITFAVFGRTLNHEFVDYDDSAYVYENPVVARGLTFQGLIWAFRGVHAHNWHPLTWLSHMLDCQLYGLRPGGHHFTNVLLHAATAITLFLALREMTGALWRGAFVAAVFAIHPLRVESVAWVAERKDVLSGLFFILTMGAYLRYARRPWSPARYGLVALLFAMGLMCKPMLVTLPVVLLLLDYWPLQRKESAGRLVMEKLPLLALSLAVGIVTLSAQHSAIQSTESFSMPLRLANALVTCMVYLGQMVWPAGLAVFYPYPRHGLPPRDVALAGMMLASLFALVLWQRQKQPWLLMGWLWYLVMLLPVVGIIQAGNQAHADRYTCLPQIGIYVALTWSAAQWRVSRVVLARLMSAILALLMVCAWRQTACWKNSETLWTHTLACTTNNDMAHYGMGDVFLKKGEWDEAIAQFQTALQIRPDYAEAHNNIGFALFKMGRADEALPHYQIALQLQPGYADAHYGLGNVFLQKGKLDEAIASYQNALRLEPGDAAVHGNLGVALFKQGKTDDAIAQFQSALQLKPGDAEALFNLGNALCQMGKADEAIPYLQQALQLRPDFAQAHYSLGIAFAKKERMAEAIRQDKEALQFDPGNPAIENTLAWLLATCPRASLRNGGQAVQLAGQASARAGGRNPIFLRTLAAALAEMGNFGQARQSAQQAIALVRAAGRQDMAKDLDGDLKRYQAGLPLHE